MKKIIFIFALAITLLFSINSSTFASTKNINSNRIVFGSSFKSSFKDFINHIYDSFIVENEDF